MRVCVVTRVIRVSRATRVGWELLYWAAHALIIGPATDTRIWTQGGVEKIPDQPVVEGERSWSTGITGALEPWSAGF